MDITISLKDLGFIMIVTAAFILLIQLIILTKNLVKTAKHTNKILEDTEIITGIASDKAQEVDQIISSIGCTTEEITQMIEGNNSILKALATIINVLAAFKGLFDVATGKKAEVGVKEPAEPAAAAEEEN